MYDLLCNTVPQYITQRDFNSLQDDGDGKNKVKRQINSEKIKNSIQGIGDSLVSSQQALLKLFGLQIM